MTPTIPSSLGVTPVMLSLCRLSIFNSLLETVYLLKSPANAAHLERSITQYKRGQVTEKDLLDD